MRFGKYVTSLQPGPHVRLPRPIEEVIKVNVERIQTITSQSSMLTGDENIVEVELCAISNQGSNQLPIQNCRSRCFREAGH